MSFLEIAKKRYAVRAFNTTPVETDKLNLILEAGRVAPTGANTQPQRLLVLQEKQNLAKLASSANLYGAPLVIIVCGDTNVVWKRPYDGKSILDIDTSIVTDHMMLQATELGLGTIWVCVFKPDVLKKDFNIPAGVEPISILGIGYASGAVLPADRHTHARLPLGSTVFFEKY
jgi:nitroreductase